MQGLLKVGSEAVFTVLVNRKTLKKILRNRAIQQLSTYSLLNWHVLCSYEWKDAANQCSILHTPPHPLPLYCLVPPPPPPG